jgi:hypothetical protein
VSRDTVDHLVVPRTQYSDSLLPECGLAALRADAQSGLCGYLSLIALIGIVLNTVWHISLADPIAALAITPLILWEGGSLQQHRSSRNNNRLHYANCRPTRHRIDSCAVTHSPCSRNNRNYRGLGIRGLAWSPSDPDFEFAMEWRKTFVGPFSAAPA